MQFRCGRLGGEDAAWFERNFRVFWLYRMAAGSESEKRGKYQAGTQGRGRRMRGISVRKAVLSVELGRNTSWSGLASDPGPVGIATASNRGSENLPWLS